MPNPGPSAVLRGAVDVCFAEAAPTHEEHWAPPLDDGEEVIIAPGIRASRLTEDLRRRLDEATQERDFNFPPGMRALTYGIVRENASRQAWDEDRTISRLLALSRIVHPSTLGATVAGTMHFDADGTLEFIVGTIGHPAYTCRSLRPWLTRKDFEDLSKIFIAYEALPVVEPPFRKLPRRLHRAIWNLAYAARVQPSHIRWLIVATSLEGIIESRQAPRQEFIQRVSAIGAEIGARMTRAEADAIYSLRSNVAHRGWFPGKEDDELDALYIPMDRLVAGILRRAIFDAEFRAVFESEQTVDARWPITIPPRRCSWGVHG